MAIREVLKTIPMLLWCPECGERHVDEEGREPHKTHACQYCGMLWRPALLETNGVQFLPGCLDEPEPEEEDDA